MATFKKFTMYVCDFNEDLSVEELQEMINQRVLDRCSTNGFCRLFEQKSVTQEWEDEHPLNYRENNENPAEWERVLNDN